MRASRIHWLSTCLVGSTLVLALQPSAMADGRLFRRKTRVVVETAAACPDPRNQLAPTGMLGTFTPTPMTIIRDNGAIGGGYSTLNLSGFGNSLSTFGPLSAFRQTSAPVNTVVRGYDGVPTTVQGTGFSNPMLPRLSPFIYPTRANNYSALPFQGTSPARDKALMWIDQN